MAHRGEGRELPRWIHPDVIVRATPLSLGAVVGLLLLSGVGSVVFFAGANQALAPIEIATDGWIHHMLAWGAIEDLIIVAAAWWAGVRMRHLGLDRRELRRWIATWVVAWCAMQVVMLGAAWLGLVAPLTARAPLSETVGLMLALLLHIGLFEEIVYRGIALPVLVRRFGVPTGVALAALVFAVSHLPFLINKGVPISAAVWTMVQYVLDATLVGVLYLRSGSLLTLAALHSVYDMPTPFAITPHGFSALVVALNVGTIAYIWLRRWPSARAESPRAGEPRADAARA